MKPEGIRIPTQFPILKLDFRNSNSFQEDSKIQEIRSSSSQNPPDEDFQENLEVFMESSKSSQKIQYSSKTSSELVSQPTNFRTTATDSKNYKKERLIPTY
jgi:hypothetical protein